MARTLRRHSVGTKLSISRTVAREKRVSNWVRLCAEGEAPAAGAVVELEAAGKTICVANVDGKLCALDNWCPHRQGPLGQGWLEGQTVVCPWHCWAFDVNSGKAQLPEEGKVAVYPVKVEKGVVLIDAG